MIMFQHPQSFKPQDFREDCVVNIAIRGFGVIFSGNPESFERAASRAPVFPLTNIAFFFVLHADIADAGLIFTDEFQEIVRMNICYRRIHPHLTLGNIAVCVKHHVAMPHAARA